ncbi:MAG: hypothetical protein E7Z80_08675 [Methanobrevibacter thaueri]|nr:hypothetical protein [Methanobrevibacter thaueri]
MEFIINYKKYSILNHELYINYLIVDSYFSQYSKYNYNIHFNFLDPVLEKEKIEFKDILEGTQELEILIEKNQINFTPYGLKINETQDNTFNIIYQTLEFNNITVGEAVPLLITLTSLLNAKPVVTLDQIDDELNHFLEKFRSYK